MPEGERFEQRAAAVIDALQRRGAIFAYLHGSRAAGTGKPDSDMDVAAYFDGHPPAAFELLLPPEVDLLVLNQAPLELAGRVAVNGKLLFERDASARVAWEATTRKIYFDELPRMTRAHKEFAETVLRRGR
ncbi:DNA polymerase III subunit beta [Mycobacterium sp. 852002-51163_SCH5372311]|uniref:type VII toxin-antitoxin system MntA family adenylyltransferase antitoxin n=1 Tax=Mycobacterium sp. 852002-51163_SCH5372311 TaxID=1834097 RepID=UPI0008011F11|nr:nucleotidyltransferase domain-containing protein [Mycobacterium sp. 852002-51163_SCH5372311]OBF92948.1 DNA polymerase III subunit beta [Mycobacterium sp. 852002-51163_SCH5372311]